MPYPPVPGRRMAFDGDGSVAVIRNTTNLAALFALTPAHKATLQSEDPDTAFTVHSVHGQSDQHNWWLAVIFPELRELDGVFADMGLPTDAVDRIRQVESSTDTTNGMDGTWVQEIANYPDTAGVIPAYRDNIQSLARSSVRSARIHFVPQVGGQATRAVHLYGDITPGQTPDRLLFIDEATGLEFTAARDFGDKPRGSSEDREWRIKNNSAALLATTIQYTAEALFQASAAWYTHTLPGGSTYQNTRQIASLGAATTSGLIKTRRITPGNEVMGLHAARVYLNTDTWS